MEFLTSSRCVCVEVGSKGMNQSLKRLKLEQEDTKTLGLYN